MSDPHFANVSLLLLGNGSNGSTTIVDSSNFGHAMTANGNAQISTSSPKFGSGALLFDGSGDSITSANHATAFNFGTGDFTIDTWFKSSTGARMDPIGMNVHYDTTGWWDIAIRTDTSSIDLLRVGGNTIVSTSSSGFIDGNWHHLAVTRSGTDVRLYLDGIHKNNAASSIQIGVDSAGFICGKLQANGAADYNGRLDCVRLTKAVARWTGTGSFTPPTSEDDYLPATGGPFPHYINDPLLGGLNAMRERVRRFISLPSGILAPRPGIILPRGC